MQPARRQDGTSPASPERGRHQDEDLFDQVDVPAAVVCALCGSADCPGCANELSRSGVVAMVAWERPGAPFFTRLWGTARATTFDSERFFESLPDGPIAPAFRFAVICELLAASAMLLASLPILVMIAPTWMRHLAMEEAGLLARLLVVGVPGLAGLLVAAHAAHGWALHHGAKKSLPSNKGASRALRFGLYAAGWDLVIGPLGALVLALKEGLRASFRVLTIAVGLPTRSARAFLRGAYRLEGLSADGPLRASYVAAVVATIVATIAVLFAVILVALI
jgi:hypothetical protein